MYLLLVLAASFFSIWASAKVNSTYKRYSSVMTRRGLTAAQAARMILDQNGLRNVRIEAIAGNLTDHFDPRDNVIRLSDSVRSSSSVAAVGVAAHEAGHAVQYATGYVPIKVRNAIVPVANIGCRFGPYLIIIGFMMYYMSYLSQLLMDVGIIFFAASVAFQIITLPVELNASGRAIKILGESGYLDEGEIPMVKSVLGSAAMTYVAAAAVSVANLLRFMAMASSRRRND